MLVGREAGFSVTPTFLGIVEPGVPVPLAQGSPLRLVLEDGHPARGLGLVELHLGTAGIGLHPADGGRGGRVWGQGTAGSETQRRGQELRWQLNSAWLRTAEGKGRAGTQRVFMELLKMLISAQILVLSPL